MRGGGVAGVEATIPTLADMSPSGREIAMAYFEAGLVEGIARGRDQLDAEWRAADAHAFAVARATADWPPFDELAERRGDHVRAAAQRETLREHGVVA